jgi:putative transposase
LRTRHPRHQVSDHQQVGGSLVLAWDNLNTHVSKVTRELTAARDWLTVFQLPAYASELNPAESAWALLKRSLAKRSLPELTALAKTRLRRMQSRPGLLEAFLARTRLRRPPSHPRRAA